jgi:tetratricopeptide (TPR) repeat protein
LVGSLYGSFVCPSLIGRDSALDALSQAVDALRHGRGQTLLLTGEAGIGKSRLLGEAIALATAGGVPALTTACFSRDRDVPYAPLIDLLRSRFLDREPDEIRLQAGPFMRELHVLLPELVPGDSPDDAARRGTEQERRRLLAALTHALIGREVEQPLLLVIDDLHWCDAASLDVLLTISHRARQHPLLLLGAYRSDEVEPPLEEWLAQLIRERLLREIPLGPLSQGDVSTMVTAIMGSDRRPPPGAVEAINAIAEGNPFYVEELLTAALTNDDGGLDRSPTPGGSLPWSLQHIAGHRIARLSSPARDVLRLAALTGRRFDFELLQRVAMVDEQTLVALIKELVSARLVVETSRDQFMFRHALIQQGVHSDLLGREKLSLHALVAGEMERLYASALEQYAGDLSYHFGEAEVWDKAFAYARLAGEQAMQVHAPRSAAQYFTRALDAALRMTPTGPPDNATTKAAPLAELYRARGHAFEIVGRFDAALADYDAAVQHAHAAGDRRAQWHGLIALGMLWAARDYARAGAQFQEALDLARTLNDPATVAHSLNCVGNWRLNTADPSLALPIHQEALVLFEEADDRHGVAQTLDLIGMASFLSADLAGTVSSYRRAAASFRDLDDRHNLVTSLALLAVRGGGYLLDSIGAGPEDLQDALRDADEALTVAQQIDWRAGEAFALYTKSLLLGYHGQYGEALDLGQRSLTIAEAIGHDQWIASACMALGAVYLDLCVYPAAREHLGRSLAVARSLGSTFWIQISSAMLAWEATQRGGFQRAEELLDAAGSAELSSRSLGQIWCAHARARLALARGDAERALTILRAYPDSW